MRVESKFLTADARIQSVKLCGRTVVMETLVKGVLPMKVELGPGDLRQMGRLLAHEARERLTAAVSARLPRALANRLRRP